MKNKELKLIGLEILLAGAAYLAIQLSTGILWLTILGGVIGVAAVVLALFIAALLLKSLAADSATGAQPKRKKSLRQRLVVGIAGFLAIAMVVSMAATMML